jgi:hypothetical protein
MNPPEFFLIMTTVIGGMALGGFFIHRVTELIRLKMERKNAEKSPDVDLLIKQNQELVQWRIKAEKRLQVLEEIVADEGDRHLLGESREPLLGSSVKGDDSTSSTVPNQLRNRS